MKKTSILTATILALALPLAASADNGTPGENFMTNWDLNSDGQVTAAEVLERRADLFDSFDANEDGILQPEELADHDAMRDAMRDANRPQGNQPGFGQGHGGGHGGQGGMMQGQRGQGRMQQPGGKSECGRMGPHAGKGQPGKMGPQGSNGQRGMGPQGGAAHNGPQQMTSQLDADGDGQISRDEFIKAGEDWLTRFDRNGDGVVTADDFAMAPNQR